jgi:CheY-like chemotaxis protein
MGNRLSADRMQIFGVKGSDYEKVMDAVVRRQPVDGRWFGPSARVRGNAGPIVSHHPSPGREPTKLFFDMNTFPPYVHPELLQDTPPDPRNVSRQRPPAAGLAGADPVPVPPKRSLRVLCIDDDAPVLESIKDLLTHFGHRVGVAPGGKRGMEMFCTAIQKGEPYDVVITDMNMPEVSGYGVAQMIKTESPDTPVILMTGAGNTMMDSGSSSASVDKVVYKPPQMHELNELLLRMAKPA